MSKIFDVLRNYFKDKISLIRVFAVVNTDSMTEEEMIDIFETEITPSNQEEIKEVEDGDDPLNAKRVEFFFHYYLTDYINKVQLQIQEKGLRIPREYILGLFIEKLASYTVKDVEVKNGDLRIIEVLGDPKTVAQEFLNDNRKFYKPAIEIDLEEAERKEAHKIYLRSLSINEKAKYYFNKYKPSTSIQDYNIKEKLGKSLSDPYKSTKVLQYSSYFHLAIFIYSLWHIPYYISTVVNSALNNISDIYNFRNNNLTIFGNYKNWLYTRYYIIILYLITLLLFKYTGVSKNQDAFKSTRRIKLLYIGHMLNVIVGGFYFIIGSLYSIAGIPVILYSFSLVRLSWIILASLYVINLVVIWKKFRLKKLEYDAELDGKTSKTANALEKLMKLPFIIYLLALNTVAGYYSFLSLEAFYTMYDREAVAIFGWISRNVNYQAAFYTLLMVLPYIWVGYLQKSDEHRLFIKKRIRLQLKIQVLFILLFNTYNLFAIYYHERIRNNLVPFSFAEGILSVYIYLGATILMLFLNRVLIKLDTPEVKKSSLWSKLRRRTNDN